jgi:hypothetical protein
VDSINSIKHHENKKDNDSDVASKLQALQIEIAELKELMKSETTKR